MMTLSNKWSLNPFGTGQCLSTRNGTEYLVRKSVSIPLEQGSVFRLATTVSATESGIRLNPFGTGQCLSTAAVCWRQEPCGLSDPLPNFLGRLRSWLLI